MIQSVVRRTVLAIALASAAMMAPTFCQAQAKSTPASGGGASGNGTTGTDPCPKGLACTAASSTGSTTHAGSASLQVILFLLGVS